MTTTLVIYLCIATLNGRCSESRATELASWSGPDSVQQCETELRKASDQMQTRAPGLRVAWRCIRPGVRI